MEKKNTILEDRDFCKEGFEITLRDSVLPYIINNIKQVHLDDAIKKFLADTTKEKCDINAMDYFSHVSASLEIFRSFLTDEGKGIFDGLITQPTPLENKDTSNLH